MYNKGLDGWRTFSVSGLSSGKNDQQHLTCRHSRSAEKPRYTEQQRAFRLINNEPRHAYRGYSPNPLSTTIHNTKNVPLFNNVVVQVITSGMEVCADTGEWCVTVCANGIPFG